MTETKNFVLESRASPTDEWVREDGFDTWIEARSALEEFRSSVLSRMARIRSTRSVAAEVAGIEASESAPAIERKIGQVAYQIALRDRMVLIAQAEKAKLHDQMEALSKRLAEITAPKAQEHTDGEG